MVVDETAEAVKDQEPKISIPKDEKLGKPVVVEDTTPQEEDIVKPVMHKEWVWEAEYDIVLKNEVKTEIFKRTYVQKPLSYLAFGEFTGLIGRKLAEAMRGPDGLSLDRITPGGASIPLEWEDGQIRLSSTEADLVDPIIQGIARLASYVPEFIGEAQCIWLRVPRSERGLLVDIWSRPVDEGGMSMDQGEEMFEIFIEQNYDELNNFLKRYARVRNVFNKMKSRSMKEG